MAVTAPGSRVVYVCGRSFADAQARSAERAELVVLHEALHTLASARTLPTAWRSPAARAGAARLRPSCRDGGRRCAAAAAPP